MTQKTIAQAAEAIIIQERNKIIKRRIKKGYRLPELDEKLRKLRTRSEARLIEKAPINVPKILKVDEQNKEITMEFINGKKLSENLDNLSNKEEVMQIIGQETAKLHDANIIHGDLTTSNMILVECESDVKKAKEVEETKEASRAKIKDSKINNNKDLTLTNKSNKLLITNQNKTNSKIYFIDFGLGFSSSKIEDKAVDIHLLKQALEAKHFLYHESLFQAFLESYNPVNKTEILAQLKKVEARGRYKH